MGFATQLKAVKDEQREQGEQADNIVAAIKALEDMQREQADRIATLELENSYLRAGQDMQISAIQNIVREQDNRIATFELEKNNVRAAQETHNQKVLARIEALEQHIEHQNARRKEAVATLLNIRTMHQDAANAFEIRARDIQPDDLEGILCVHGTSIVTVLNHHQRALAHLSANSLSVPTANFVHGAARAVQRVGPPAYAKGYQAGYYCQAHSQPYPCRVCGQ